MQGHDRIYEPQPSHRRGRGFHQRVAALDDQFQLNTLQGGATVGRRGGALASSRASGSGSAAELAAKETACCSFFTFTFTLADGRSTMSVSVGAAHEDVLEALAARAAALMDSAA